MCIRDRHKGRYNFTTSLKTYLFMLGRSRALNYLKRESKFRVIELTDAEAETADYRALEERLIAQEEKIAVNAALNRLPEEYRTVLHLIYFEELSYEEAARVMRKSRKQVDNLLYRAKKALRSAMGREGGA